MITSCDAMQWSDQFMCALYVWFLILFWSFLLVCLLTAAGNHWGHRCHLCRQLGRRLGSEQRLPSGRWRWGALSSTSWSTGSGFQKQTKSVVKHYCSWLGYYFLFWLDRYVYVVGEVGRWLTGQWPGRRQWKRLLLLLPESGLWVWSKDKLPMKNRPFKIYVAKMKSKSSKKRKSTTDIFAAERRTCAGSWFTIDWDIEVCETSTNGFTTSFGTKGEEDEIWKCSHENSRRKNYGK